MGLDAHDVLDALPQVQQRMTPEMIERLLQSDNSSVREFAEKVREKAKPVAQAKLSLRERGKIFLGRARATVDDLLGRGAEPVEKPRVVKAPLVRTRDWSVPLGNIKGRAGQILTVTSTPQMHFRSEKILATDDSDDYGMGTKIVMIMVGGRVQSFGFGNGSLSRTFAYNAVGNGTQFQTCRAGLTITFQVEFLVDCEWTCTLFGKAAE